MLRSPPPRGNGALSVARGPPMASRDPNGHPAAPRAPASLRAVLALTWLNSVTTASVTIGLPFIAQAAFDFNARQNLMLGLALGLGYIPGAMGVGPGLRRLAERLPWLSTRAAVGVVLMLLAVVGAMPWIFRAHSWVIWPTVFFYNMISGALWPIVESYLSGGRRAERLRTATATFNVTWASAGVAMAWGIAPLINAGHALLVLPIASLITISSSVILLAFPKEPPRHVHEERPHPPVYEPLLKVFRFLLPTSYFLMYCLGPLLPTIISRLQVPIAWATPLASTFLISRTLVFLLFGLWHGWHGRWRTPLWTGGTLMLGFGLAVTAPSVPILAAGLALFGIGLGGVYAAALYYAMEVGGAEVDAGGTHETLIGLGYTFGPLVGLAGFAAAAGAEKPDEGPLFTVGIALALSALALGYALRGVIRFRNA